MIAIPLPMLGQRTYIDENALQPGQVCDPSINHLMTLLHRVMSRSIPIGTGVTYTARIDTLRRWSNYEIGTHRVLSRFDFSDRRSTCSDRQLHRIADYIALEFRRAGLPADVQTFTFTLATGVRILCSLPCVLPVLILTVEIWS